MQGIAEMRPLSISENIYICLTLIDAFWGVTHQPTQQ